MTPTKNNIKSKREKLKLSQWALADKLNVTQAWMSTIENGWVIPSPASQEKIATALNCSVSDIWTGGSDG